ncbi:MAG: sulfatase [Marinilabiliaceae bacterium]|nr:sulfatase [Marinilabiliaceae bacterium]
MKQQGIQKLFLEKKILSKLMLSSRKSLLLTLGLTLSYNVMAQQKNVLFIAVDDLKPIGGCYDRPEVKTPNMDLLAQTGFVFKNNHCQQAVCAPTRASLLTGKRPDYTQIWDLKTQIRDMNPDIRTMPQYFKEKGYQTAAVGKVFDLRSVDSQHDSLSWSKPYVSMKSSNVTGGGYIHETKRVSTECADVPDSVTLDGRVVAESIQLLDELSTDEQPFFLAVGFHKPHLPFVAPKKYWDLYDRDQIQLASYREKPIGAPGYASQPGWEVRSQYDDVPKDFKVPISEEKQKELIHGYYACVSFIDQQIGNLIAYLDEKGLRQNTVIVLWGDHGWHLGDHDMWCKHTNYEQATRSPLMVALGDNYIGQSSSPTEFVDVFPTLCQLAGVETPNDIDGLSLVPLITGELTSLKPHAVSQFHRNKVLMGYAFRNERYRYIIWLKDNYRSNQPYRSELIDAEELYDYTLDPLETTNQATNPEYSSIRQEMLEKAIQFFKEQQ